MELTSKYSGMRKEYAVNEQDKAKNTFSQSLDRFSVYLCENVSYIKIPLRAQERSKGDPACPSISQNPSR